MDGPQLKKNNNINCCKALVSPSAADRVSQPKEQKITKGKERDMIRLSLSMWNGILQCITLPNWKRQQ